MALTNMVMEYSSSIYTDSTWHSVRKLPSRVERMHCSVGGAGLGHTSVGGVFSVSGSGRVCPGSSGIRSRFTLTSIPRHFWECRACLGYGPAPRPTEKRSCGIPVRLVGRKTNTDNLQAAWQYRKDIPNCCITPVFCIFVLLL